MDDAHTIAPRPLIRLLAALVVAAGSWFMLADWRDPCRGQITDLLGCYTASVEADQAQAETLRQHRATLTPAWAEWCAVEDQKSFRFPGYETQCLP